MVRMPEELEGARKEAGRRQEGDREEVERGWKGGKEGAGRGCFPTGAQRFRERLSATLGQ